MSVRWIFVAMLLSGLVLPAYGLPQSGVSMSAVEVDLWPEYDRPNMLVIYKVTLAPEVRLPVALNLRIPAAAGRPNAVAEKQLDGRLTSINYDQREQDEWASIIFTASRPEVQIEYYDPRLVKAEANRRFIYTWPADYPVGALSVQVQQPPDALNLRMEPAAEHTSPAGEGFTYHILHLQARGAGEPVEVSVEYVKESDTLSVASMPQAAPAQPATSPVTVLPSEGGGGIPLWVYVVLAVVAAATGGGLWWRSGRGDGQADAVRASTTSRGTRQAASPAATGGAAFCTQCGTRAHAGDRFCNACGAQLPSE